MSSLSSVLSTPRGRKGRTSASIGTPRRSQRLTPKPSSTPARVEDVLEEGDHYVIKATNSPVPVQVQEVLRSDSRVLGVKLDPSGWGMLLASGNKLLIWRYLTDQVSTKCYDITLPSSGKGWHINLLVFTAGSSDLKASLLACSPEGDVYWWSDVLQAVAVTLQGSVNMGDSMVFAVNSIVDGHGRDECLVVSCQASMWVVSPAVESGMSVQSLSQPEGMLSGLGKRMTSMFFGSAASVQVKVKQVRTHLTNQGHVMAFILTGTNIQRWNVSRSGDQLSVDAPVLEHVKESVMANGWVEPSCSPNLSFLDFQVTQDSLALLFAFSETAESVELGIDMKRLIRLQQTVSTVDSSLLSSFALHSSLEVPILALVSKAGLVLSDAVKDLFEPQVIPFSQSDMILGVGHREEQLFLFMRSHGLVTIATRAGASAKGGGRGRRKAGSGSSVRFQEGKSGHLLDTSFQGGGGVGPSHHLVSSEATAEAAGQLQTAFTIFLDGNIARAISLCEEKFPVSSSSRGAVNTLGDMAVVHYSQLILDDPPSPVDLSDPSSGNSGGQGSMIVFYRLQQKIEAHSKYLHFLEEVGMMERLASVRHGNMTTPTRVTPTRQVLQEHAELLQAALSLRKIHDQFVDGVIGEVLHGRSVPTAMSNNDAFYTSVSTFPDFFPALIRHQTTRLAATDKAVEKVKVILGGATVLEAVLHNVLFFRQSKASGSESTEVKIPQQPPWTTSEGSSGIISIITEQLDLIVVVGVADAESQDLHSLWNAAANLMDILFESYKTLISCLNDNSKIEDARAVFVAQRKKYLSVLLKHGQLAAVSDLAERYHDFRILVTLCQESCNRGKLKEYVHRFSEQGFSDFLFKMYLDEGKLQQLLSFSKDFPSELTDFIESHPYLAWLHYLATQDYMAAYKTLDNLAQSEAKYARRKKTLLSLSKLSLLAATPGEVTHTRLEELDKQLHHIQVQEGVPSGALEGAGMDYDLIPPQSPMNIVKMYIGEFCPDSGEEQFLQVVDYLVFCSKNLEKEKVDDLFLYTWSQAVLKDNWKDLSIEEPVQELQKTFFFRIVEELFHRNVDVRVLLPDLSSLVHYPSIMEAGLSGSHSFTYLMKVGYEQMERVYSSKGT